MRARMSAGVSARITPRLPDRPIGLRHAGIPGSRGLRARRHVRRRGHDERGAAQSRARQPLRARAACCALARAASGGVPRRPALGNARREHDRPIADHDHAVHGRCRGAADHRGHRRVLFMEPHRNAASRHGSSSRDTDRWRRPRSTPSCARPLAERAKLIAGRGRRKRGFRGI